MDIQLNLVHEALSEGGAVKRAEDVLVDEVREEVEDTNQEAFEGGFFQLFCATRPEGK